MNMNKKVIMLVMTLGLFQLTACSVTHGTQMTAQQITSIHKGVTSEGQIRQMFGEPVEKQRLSNGLTRLIYRYDNSSQIMKGLAGAGGTLLGGVLGYQVGGGSGQALATMAGAGIGGALSENAVTARKQEQILIIYINQRGIVHDYEFTENSSRSQSWGIGQGVKPL